MSPTGSDKDTAVFNLSEKHYKELWRKNIFRLSAIYLLPTIILALFFLHQYNILLEKSRSSHLRSVAENQAHMLNLFLNERVVNLINLIDDPSFSIPPDRNSMELYLEKLKKDSEAFTDIDFFDSSGSRLIYAGPIEVKEGANYKNEQWFRNLYDEEKRFVITDIYLGYRNNPHFTIGVKAIKDNEYCVLRATLEPGKIYEYMTSIEELSDVSIFIINEEGNYQCVSPEIAGVLTNSNLNPPRNIQWGIVENENSSIYAYSWVKATNWALIVQPSGSSQDEYLEQRVSILSIAGVVIFLIILIVIIRAKKNAEFEKDKDMVRLQLEHASKLASVGELAGGIAHEINNPLAIIASEAGLIKDFMNPDFGIEFKPENMTQHLDNINEAVFRARDITRKLLSFVRKDDITLKRQNINDIINELTDGFLEREYEVSNIRLKKKLEPDLPLITTDGNQLKQVFLNILNNAVDAIDAPGTINIVTGTKDAFISVAISDSGKGIRKEEIDKIFMPFFTTKEVGKGTGLGLSVSYNIIKNLGGNIEVESIPGKGSTFSIYLPIKYGI